MEQYVGLDVSLKMTAICIVDRTGKIEREGMVASDPAAIAAFVSVARPTTGYWDGSVLTGMRVKSYRV